MAVVDDPQILLNLHPQYLNGQCRCGERGCRLREVAMASLTRAGRPHRRIPGLTRPELVGARRVTR
jgi:hypothetical protein